MRKYKKKKKKQNKLTNINKQKNHGSKYLGTKTMEYYL